MNLTPGQLWGQTRSPARAGQQHMRVQGGKPKAPISIIRVRHE
jgi:hypothetical protein